MSLKITKSSEPIEVRTITACLYSPPGIGKTTTAFTADRCLLLDFDKGSYRAKNRGDVVQVETWDDVVSITADDLKSYRTLAVDTAGRALDVLAPSIIASDAKMGRGGALTLQGFGRLKSEFIAWTKLVRSFGIDIILICHSDESKSGDDLIERLDMQGGSKGEVYKSADLMGRIYLKNGKRMLNFSPTDTAFGKNPAQLPPIEIPDFNTTPDFFAGVIAKVKTSLNELSAAQVAAAAALADWKGRIDGAVSVDDFNGLIDPAKAADETVRENVKRLLVKTGKERGFTFDVKLVAFTAPAEAKKADVAPVAQGTTTVVASATEAAAVAARLADEQAAAREPGSDDDEAANRAAAAPTEAEVQKMEAEKSRPARKGKAA